MSSKDKTPTYRNRYFPPRSYTRSEACRALPTVEERLFRPLLPAGHGANQPSYPSTSDENSNNSAGESSRSGRCGLIQCRKLICNLSSHRQFAALHRSAQHHKRSSTKFPPIPNPRQQPRHLLIECSVSRIERQIADGFPTLPCISESSSTFRELVHHYFGYQIDRLATIFSPHLDRRKYKSTMMDHALSNDVFCICIAANAKTDMLMRGHIRTPDRSSELVYAATAHILRQRIDNFRHTDADWLLVLVVALVGFDLAFERTKNLKAHHIALTQLVSLKGGIHTVGHTLPYVLNTDRFLAVFTGQYPAFKSTPIMPASPRCSEEESSYGKAFQTFSIKEDIDQVVIDFCLKQCQLIHLMETTHLSLSPRSPPTSDPSVISYFLYTRDRLLGEGTVLHADYHDNRNMNDDGTASDKQHTEKSLSKSRCVLLATMMVEYVVVHANYYTVKGPFLANQLKSVLDKQPLTEWSDHVDSLIWVLFVAAVVPERWEHHQWALDKLRDQLAVKYDGSLAQSGWEDGIAALMKRYVWSQMFETRYKKVCAELVMGQKL